MTPLHLAVTENQKEMVQVLLSVGANPFIVTKSGKHAVQSATDEAMRSLLTAASSKLTGGMKTSQSDPLQVDFLPPGILKFPNAAIGMCMCPGRNKKDHRRNLTLDLERLKTIYRADVLVSLVMDKELLAMGIPDLIERAQQSKISTFHFPIYDKWIPNSLQILHVVVQKLIEFLSNGKVVVVHCNGGKGRTGLVVVSILIALGYEASGAVEIVRSARSGMLQNPLQIVFVNRFQSTYYPNNTPISSGGNSNT